MIRPSLVLAAAFAACAAAPGPRAPARQSPSDEGQARATDDRRLVHYALAIPDPARQWVHVTLTVARPKGRRSQIAMPAWTPGSYLVRDFARHVDGLRAEDLEGRPLPVHHLDKQTWRVEHGPRGFRVHYRVFADEPGVRTSHVDDRHASLNGASIFLYVVGQTDRPASLDITLPAGWQAHSALAPAATNAATSAATNAPTSTAATTSAPTATNAPTSTAASASAASTPSLARFAAPDYDTLVDSPIVLGTPELRAFTSAGARVELVFAAPAGSNADTARIAADLQKIVAAFARMMDGLPLRRYVFLVLADETGDGGLEHAASTLLRVPKDMFSEPAGYRKFANLAAHEFFHLWNVKRLRDAALLPYDYRGEDYTRLLWFHEGFTETMEQQALIRAGLVPGDEYLRELATGWGAYLRRPGRNHAPLGELSHDAWIKAYKPSPAHGNTLVSYYEKGYLLGVCLDLELRLRSAANGRQGSLLGLFRRLMASHGARGKGLVYADIIAAAGAEAGEAMNAFFARHVDATDELPLPGLLARIGVRVTGETSPKGHTGLVLTAERTIKNIEPDSPAAAAGLMLGDELIAVAGSRVRSGDEALARLGERRPGDSVEVAVFRAGRLLVRPLTVTADPHRDFRFELAPEASLTPQTLGLRRAWLARDP